MERFCYRGQRVMLFRGKKTREKTERIFGEGKEQAATEGFFFQGDFGGEIFWLREQTAEGGFSWLLRCLKLNRTLPEKGTLRYECSRYIVLFWILTIPLHFLLISGYLLVCLGWIDEGHLLLVDIILNSCLPLLILMHLASIAKYLGIMPIVIFDVVFLT